MDLDHFLDFLNILLNSSFIDWKFRTDIRFLSRTKREKAGSMSDLNFGPLFEDPLLRESNNDPCLAPTFSRDS